MGHPIDNRKRMRAKWHNKRIYERGPKWAYDVSCCPWAAGWLAEAGKSSAVCVFWTQPPTWSPWHFNDPTLDIAKCGPSVLSLQSCSLSLREAPEKDGNRTGNGSGINIYVCRRALSLHLRAVGSALTGYIHRRQGRLSERPIPSPSPSGWAPPPPTLHFEPKTKNREPKWRRQWPLKAGAVWQQGPTFGRIPPVGSYRLALAWKASCRGGSACSPHSDANPLTTRSPQGRITLISIPADRRPTTSHHGNDDHAYCSSNLSNVLLIYPGECLCFCARCVCGVGVGSYQLQKELHLACSFQRWQFN